MSGARKSKTILVADDNDEIRYLVEVAMQQQGYRVLRAANGEEAIAVARAEHPDLILMDLSMPERSGISAIYRIRKESKLRDVTIIAMTAYADAELHLDALKAGCDAYITKPFDVGTLTDMVNTSLREN